MSRSSFRPLALPEAHPWAVERWINASQALTLDSLKGQVVVLVAFQMLCPGCVLKGIPQAQKLAQSFPAGEVAVVGLHTVFEHHSVMNPAALEVFVAEFGITFPIGIDRSSPGQPIPQTMAAYGMKGTPSYVVYDREGQVDTTHFGHWDDLLLGATIGRLVSNQRS